MPAERRYLDNSLNEVSGYLSDNQKMIVKNLVLFIVAVFLGIPATGRADDFFPIGMFSVGPENLEIVKEAGFNTAHTYITDRAILQNYIKAAESIGINLLMYPSERADKGLIDHEKARTFIESSRRSKSILAWFIADEPELNGGGPREIKEIHTFMKKLDPERPTAAVIHRSDRYEQYRGASDILMTDRYPVPNTPLNHIAETTQWAVIQKGDSGPVWAIIQAFGYQNPQLKGWGLREPTYNEMRAMTFLSIIYGAKGIFYFTFTGSQYQILESADHWNDLKKIVRELNDIYPLLLAPGDYRSVGIKILEGPQEDDRVLLPVHVAEKHLSKDFGDFKAGRYFIAANATDRIIKARFSLDGRSELKRSVLNSINEKKSVKVDRGVFFNTLRPYDVHIFRVERSDQD